MRAVKGASGGETGQDMTTRHNACVVAATAMLLAVSTAQAATIHVDDDNCPGPGDGSVGNPYCSIQIAIDNAVDTDEIVVAPGTYFEIIDFLGKAITLRSSGGPEVTIIDANFDGGPGVTCESGERADTVPCLESSRWSRANLAPSVIDCYGFGPIQ